MKFLVIAVLVAAVCADVSHIARSAEADAKILEQEYDAGVNGEYISKYKTDNGISASEQGGLRSVPGSEVPAEVVQGQARWTAPNGEVVEFSYSADENGYQAQGPWIPTPPPIPEEILKALAYIQANPRKED